MWLQMIVVVLVLGTKFFPFAAATNLRLIDTEHELVVNKKQHLPVLMLHGIGNRAEGFKTMVKTIQQNHPGTLTIPLHSFDGVPDSWVALKYQLGGLRHVIASTKHKYKDQFKDGYHLVCHSQGAILCRAFCQTTPNHGVNTLISMAGPQTGVFGPAWLKFLPSKLRNVTTDEAYKLAYQHWLQESVSAANLWNDPYHQQEYLANNLFLPRINGQLKSSAGKPIVHDEDRLNLMQLQKAVFIVGNVSNNSVPAEEFDGGIEPWQSGVFGSYVPEQGGHGSGGNRFMSYSEQDFYVHDTFGLRSLDIAGKLVIHAPPNVKHDDWIYDVGVIEKYIIPLLI